MKQPKVSVIIPVYNLERYLHRCLDSVTRQTLTDIEIICINDGSDDGSLAMLRAYEQADPRIRVIDKENGGQGLARNIGIDMARGEYLGFVDGDDWIEADMYEKMYHAAKKNNADLQLCTVTRLDTDGKVLGIQCNYDRYIGNRFNNEAVVFTWNDIADVLFKLERFSVNKIYKRTFIKNNNIRFSLHRCYEDNIFHFRTLFEAERISIVRTPFYNYMFNRKGASSSKTKNVATLFDVNLEIIEYMKAHKVKSELMQRFDNYRIRRYLSYYYISDKKNRESFFDRMKAEFQTLAVDDNPFINGPEKMFYLLVRAVPYPLFRVTHMPGYVCFNIYMRMWLKNFKINPLDVV